MHRTVSSRAATLLDFFNDRPASAAARASRPTASTGVARTHPAGGCAITGGEPARTGTVVTARLGCRRDRPSGQRRAPGRSGDAVLVVAPGRRTTPLGARRSGLRTPVNARWPSVGRPGAERHGRRVARARLVVP